MSHLNLDDLPLYEYQKFYKLWFESNNSGYGYKKFWKLQDKAVMKKLKLNFC